MNNDLGKHIGLREQKIAHGHKNATKTEEYQGESASRKFDEKAFKLGTIYNTPAVHKLKTATLCRLQCGKKNGLQAPRPSPASPWRAALQNKTAGANEAAQSAAATPLSKETSQEIKGETRQPARAERHLGATKPVRQTTIRWQDITSQSQNDFEMDQHMMRKSLWKATAQSRDERSRKHRLQRNKCIPMASTDFSKIVKGNAKLACKIVGSAADLLHKLDARDRFVDVTKVRASNEIKLDSIASPTLISKKVSDILDHVNNKTPNDINFKIPCARYGRKILPSL